MPTRQIRARETAQMFIKASPGTRLVNSGIERQQSVGESLTRKLKGVSTHALRAI